MKTAMTLLYDEIESFKGLTDMVSITDVQRMIGNLYLETEKQQIIDAYDYGLEDGINDGGEDAESYYTSTFETNKETLK